MCIQIFQTTLLRCLNSAASDAYPKAREQTIPPYYYGAYVKHERCLLSSMSPPPTRFGISRRN